MHDGGGCFLKKSFGLSIHINVRTRAVGLQIERGLVSHQRTRLTLNIIGKRWSWSKVTSRFFPFISSWLSMEKMPLLTKIAKRSTLETTERTIRPSESLLSVFISYIGFVWVLSSTQESKNKLLFKYAKKEVNWKVILATMQRVIGHAPLACYWAKAFLLFHYPKHWKNKAKDVAPKLCMMGAGSFLKNPSVFRFTSTPEQGLLAYRLNEDSSHIRGQVLHWT